MNGRCVWCGALAIGSPCDGILWLQTPELADCEHELLEPTSWPVTNFEPLRWDRP